jgi:hypothetical protein
MAMKRMLGLSAAVKAEVKTRRKRARMDFMAKQMSPQKEFHPSGASVDDGGLS